MATWDSADLLARCILLAARPSSDQAMSTAQWYSELTAAQYYWYGQFAVHCPYVLISAPTLITSSDGGVTYNMPSSSRPLYVEVYDSDNGMRLEPCSYDDLNGDYVWEGTKIRMPGNNAKVFADGPYVRYIAPPGDLDGSNAPTLVPVEARLLLVYHAVAEWARQGGFRDPTPFEKKEHQLAWGVPGTGDMGIVGRLKNQDPSYGKIAYRRPFAGIGVRLLAGLNPA